MNEFIFSKAVILDCINWTWCTFIWYGRGQKRTPLQLSVLTFFLYELKPWLFLTFIFIVWDVFWSIFSSVAPFSQKLFQTAWKKCHKRSKKPKFAKTRVSQMPTSARKGYSCCQFYWSKAFMYQEKMAVLKSPKVTQPSTDESLFLQLQKAKWNLSNFTSPHLLIDK